MHALSVLRIFFRAGLLPAGLFLLSFRACGAAGDVDLSFDPGSGLDGMVSALALQPDGKVIIAGSFTEVRGLARSGLARLNEDGSGDGSFVPAAGGAACVLVQPDGKLLAGSVRLHADGSLDTGFHIPVITDYDSISHGPQAMAVLSWSPDAGNLQLQETTDLSQPSSWSRVTLTPVLNGHQIEVTVPAVSTRRFFRLATPYPNER